MHKPVFRRFPWQSEIWQRLQQARRQQRLPHALLFAGPAGVGKGDLAQAFAQALLCGSPDEQGEACGRCRHCHLLQSGTHPDLQWVEPEEDSKSGEIKIDRIRSLTEGANLTVQSGGHKVVIIRPADRMNSAAANSLLKTLEEPTPGTVLMLLTDRPSRLLPTTRSRCQLFGFPLPQRELAIQWLQERVQAGEPEILLHLAGGAPLKALALDDGEILSLRREMLRDFLNLGNNRLDPVKLAANWSKQDIKQLLEWLTGWVIDMLRLQTGESPPQLFNWDERKALQVMAKRLNSNLLQRFLGQAYEVFGLAEGNLNPQLMLEKLLIEWHACLRQAIPEGAPVRPAPATLVSKNGR